MTVSLRYPPPHISIVTVAVRPAGGRLLPEGRQGSGGAGGGGGLQPRQVQHDGDSGEQEDDRGEVGGGHSSQQAAL